MFFTYGYTYVKINVTLHFKSIHQELLIIFIYLIVCFCSNFAFHYMRSNDRRHGNFWALPQVLFTDITHDGCFHSPDIYFGV